MTSVTALCRSPVNRVYKMFSLGRNFVYGVHWTLKK